VSAKQKPDKCWISVEVDRDVRDRLAAKAQKRGINSLAPYVRQVLIKAAK
jgi:hypothetical protein